MNAIWLWLHGWHRTDRSKSPVWICKRKKVAACYSRVTREWYAWHINGHDGQWIFTYRNVRELTALRGAK